jgi:hypothetical protein
LGFALQSLVPLAQPYAVSSALALMSLDSHGLLHHSIPSPKLAPRASIESVKQIRGPSPSGPCSTRESDHHDQRFRSVAARSSLGLRPSRVLPLAGMARSSSSLPSCGSRKLRAAPAPTTGSPLPASPACLPKETADPPGVHGLMTVTIVRVRHGSGVASSWIGVRHRPLPSSL